MRVDTKPFAKKNVSLSKEPRYVVEVAFDTANTILWYFTSHADAALPPGASSISSVVEALSGTSQTLNPDTANATIGNINFSLVDLAGVVTQLLGNELVLGRSTRHQRVRVYMGYEGLDWVDYALLPMTQLITEISDSFGTKKFTCNDIQREMRKDIFVLAKTTLESTITSTATSIPVSVGFGSPLSAFELLAHGTSYSDAPSATVGYIKIEDEIIRYTGKSAGGFTGCTRGALNTRAAVHAVDPAVSAERRLALSEYVYLEMPAPKLMYALLTGILHGQGVGSPLVEDRLPSSWNLGISTDYVRLADYTGIGADLWNTSDDEQGIIVFGEDLEKLDGKKFIETELALLCGLFMPIYADGALGLKRMSSVLAGAAYVAMLDETNVVSYTDLVHDYGALHNVLQISWNWEPLRSDFTRVNLLIDSASITIHGKADPLKLKFRLLHGSRSSSASLQQRFDSLRDRYTGPPLRITVTVLPSLNTLEVGDVVRLKLANVRDITVPEDTERPLDRSFEIQNITVDWMTGNLVLKLFASSQAPVAVPSTSDAFVLSQAWYVGSGTPLSSVLTITGSNPGHVTVGGTLTGSADMHAAGAIYYYDGDLQIDQLVNINITANVWIRVRGHIQNNGTINGKGFGLGGVAAPTNPLLATDVALGTQGFLGSTEGGGAVFAKAQTVNSLRGAQVVGRNHSLPKFNLNWDGTTLNGVPTDLRGTSGSSGLPAGRVRDNTPDSNVEFDLRNSRALGGFGGSGGAGLCITCRGFAQGAAGVIDLSGNDGGLGGSIVQFLVEFSDRSKDDRIAGGSGAGGAPGGLLVLLDGAAVTATGLTDAGFVALQGKTPIVPDPIDSPAQTNVTMGPSTNLIYIFQGHTFYSYYTGTGDGTTFDLPNYSGVRAGNPVQFVPGIDAPVADPAAATLPMPSNLGLASGTSELLLQGDGTIVSRIKVTWTPAPDSRVAGYDIQFKPSSGTIWSSIPPVIGQEANTAWIVGMRDGINTDIRIRSAGRTREVSDWLEIDNYFVIGKTAKPADVGTITYAEPVITWLPNTTDPDLAGYIVRYQPSWASADWNSALIPLGAGALGFITATEFDTLKMIGGQVTMLVKCVDTTGNESTNVSSKQIDLRPPVPTGFTVTRQPDGTRELAWILASPPSDLDGYRIKWFLGSTSDWTAMTLLHTGVLKASPFESNQLAAGTYTFAIKSVDKAGNESATALFIDSLTIGDPRIAGSIEDFLEEPTWTETKTNAVLDGATGWLVATGSGSWNTIPTTWDAWNSWIVTPSGSIQYERKIDVGLITTFTPLVTVVADSAGGSVVIEEAHSNVDSGYSAFAAVGPELLTRWIKIRVTVTGTFPKLKSERIILSATPIEEEITDLSTSTLTGAHRIGTGDIRLPITKAYNVIKKVDVTLQSVGAGWSVELIDKDTSVGPRIKIYNSSNTLADALIDATVKGV